MTRKLVKTCTNFIAMVLGILGGLLFFKDLLPLDRTTGFETMSDYFVLVSDVIFSLLACALSAVFAKFVLWDCIMEPLLVFASRNRRRKQ